MPPPVKVLYIAGAGRTGSTLIEKLLGQLDGVFAGGELTFMWGYALRGRCSCGLDLVACPTWQAVFDEAYGGFDGIDADEMVRLRARCDSRTLPLLVSKAAARRLLDRLGPFPERVERLYEAIATTTGCRTIIDSSKEPHYAWVLRQRTGLDVRVLHLVRDPRAVAHSWSKRKEQAGIPGTFMEQRSAAVSSTYYAVSNVAAEALLRGGPYARVRYEEAVADPAALGRIAGELMDEPMDLTTVLPDGRHGDVQGTHSCWGNPNRFETGPVTLRLDDAWVGQLEPRPRRTVEVLNGPLLRRYGYPRDGVNHGEAPGST
jgi:hypothetical protein